MLSVTVVRAVDQVKHKIYIAEDVYNCIEVKDDSGNEKLAQKENNSWVIQAYEGEKLILTSKMGYQSNEVEELYVYKIENDSQKPLMSFNFVESQASSFKMYDCDVKLVGSVKAVEFSLKADMDPVNAGKVKGLPFFAAVGDEVTFSVIPADNYQVGSIGVYVLNESDEGYTSRFSFKLNEGNTYNFKMPRGNVRIKVDFESVSVGSVIDSDTYYYDERDDIDCILDANDVSESNGVSNGSEDKNANKGNSAKSVMLSDNENEFNNIDSTLTKNETNEDAVASSAENIVKTGDSVNTFWICLLCLYMVLSVVFFTRFIKFGDTKKL